MFQSFKLRFCLMFCQCEDIQMHASQLCDIFVAASPVLARGNGRKEGAGISTLGSCLKHLKRLRPNAPGHQGPQAPQVLRRPFPPSSSITTRKAQYYNY
jgi:hypothetical protein